MLQATPDVDSSTDIETSVNKSFAKYFCKKKNLQKKNGFFKTGIVSTFSITLSFDAATLPLIVANTGAEKIAWFTLFF